MASLLVSLSHWETELAAIPTAPAGDVPKRHMLASLRQARQSLKQLIERSEGRE